MKRIGCGVAMILFGAFLNTPGGARNLEIMWGGIGSWRG